MESEAEDQTANTSVVPLQLQSQQSSTNNLIGHGHGVPKPSPVAPNIVISSYDDDNGIESEHAWNEEDSDPKDDADEDAEHTDDDADEPQDTTGSPTSDGNGVLERADYLEDTIYYDPNTLQLPQPLVYPYLTPIITDNVLSAAHNTEVINSWQQVLTNRSLSAQILLNEEPRQLNYIVTLISNVQNEAHRVHKIYRESLRYNFTEQAGGYHEIYKGFMDIAKKLLEVDGLLTSDKAKDKWMEMVDGMVEKEEIPDDLKWVEERVERYSKGVVRTVQSEDAEEKEGEGEEIEDAPPGQEDRDVRITVAEVDEDEDDELDTQRYLGEHGHEGVMDIVMKNTGGGDRAKQIHTEYIMDVDLGNLLSGHLKRDAR